MVPRIATSVAHSFLVCGSEGIRVSRRTWPQSAPTTNAVMGYAKSTSTSHLSTFAIWTISEPDGCPRDEKCERQYKPVGIDAGQHGSRIRHARQVGRNIYRVGDQKGNDEDEQQPSWKSLFEISGQTLPVTLPMRAHMIWTAAIIGHVSECGP